MALTCDGSIPLTVVGIPIFVIAGFPSKSPDEKPQHRRSVAVAAQNRDSPAKSFEIAVLIVKEVEPVALPSLAEIVIIEGEDGACT